MRRFFYWVPADGMPALVAHAIEIEAFGELPGDVLRYDGWASLRSRLEKILPRRGPVAMEHQDIGGNPDLSRVDAGTVELVRSYGPRVVSSADVANRFLGPWREADESAHARALAKVIEAEEEVCAFLASTRTPLESEVRARATASIESRGLVLGRPPMVATGSHTRDRHHRPRLDRDRRVLPRDLVAIDLVARDPERTAPFVHRGLVASIDETQPDHEAAFAVAREARDAAVEAVRQRARTGLRLLGFEVDEIARTVIEKSGAGLVHRTGHHLGRVPFSGEACTFDGFEVHDTREVVPGLAWSVHPGVYREEFGLRAAASIQRTGDGVRVLDGGQESIRLIVRS
jgi:Xaa-Pro aminopeptidase